MIWTLVVLFLINADTVHACGKLTFSSSSYDLCCSHDASCSYPCSDCQGGTWYDFGAGLTCVCAVQPSSDDDFCGVGGYCLHDGTISPSCYGSDVKWRYMEAGTCPVTDDSLNGVVAKIRWGVACQLTKEGVWDASEDKLVTCSGPRQIDSYECMGPNQPLYIESIPPVCEVVCGAEPECDEREVGEWCGLGDMACNLYCECRPGPEPECLTCVDAGFECGVWPDGCDGTIDCGTCPGTDTSCYCVGGGCVDCTTDPLVEGPVCYNDACCDPYTCSERGYECGVWSDGCGGTINCGNCIGDLECQSGECACDPSEFKCGDSSCCTPGQVCDDGVCCTPDCTGKECGNTDGCGGSCGTCPGTDTDCSCDEDPASPTYGTCLDCTTSGGECIDGTCATDCDSCDPKVYGTCGTGGCAWNKKPWTQDCTGGALCVDPSGCDCHEDCCTGWSDQGCNFGGCVDKMYQTRNCGDCGPVPFSETRCVYDPLCAPSCTDGECDLINRVICIDGSWSAQEDPLYCDIDRCNHCADGVQSCDETGVDCGGADCGGCGACTPGECDLVSRRYCLPDGTWSAPESSEYCDIANCDHCSDSVQNCGEAGVDCGAFGCADCEFVIYKGWNLISTPHDSITSVLTDTCGATNGKFYYYNAQTGKWVVDTVGIQNLQKGVSYWFYSTKNCVIDVAGSGTVTEADISLHAGWNQVGAPTGGMSDVDSMMDNCHSSSCSDSACSSMKVLWYNPVSQSWQQVNTMQAWKGYSVQCID